MPRTSDATALAGVAALLVAGFGAVTVAFDDTASVSAADLESIWASVFEVAPLALVLLVGYLVVVKMDLI
jgi:hypothetical protein